MRDNAYAPQTVVSYCRADETDAACKERAQAQLEARLATEWRMEATEYAEISVLPALTRAKGWFDEVPRRVLFRFNRKPLA